MIENIVKDELSKNSVMDIYSVKFSTLYFQNFSGEYSCSLFTNLQISCGYIFVSCFDCDNLIIMLNNVVIMSKVNQNVSQLIPIFIEKNSCMTIKGSCSNLSINMYGARFEYLHRDYLVPATNQLVRFDGNYKVFLIGQLGDIVTNNITFVRQFDNLLDYQAFKFGSNVYSGALYKLDNNVYFTHSINNYAINILITSDAISAKMMTNVSSNCLEIMYVKDNKLFYKTLTSEMVLSAESEIEMNALNKINCLIDIEYNEFSRYFGLKHDDESIGIFQLLDTGYLKLVSAKGDF